MPKYNKTIKTVVEVVQEPATIVEEQRVAIRSIYESTMRYPSQTTGELYTWNKIGDVVLVLSEDAEVLLQKRIGGISCCGGTNQNGNRIFELA